MRENDGLDVSQLLLQFYLFFKSLVVANIQDLKVYEILTKKR